ncbi:methylenetetrahydrofolate reductase [NAD(P)H] [Cohaesibacter celericrescens]|uniref:Methylenetetrahydrofolate reductase n=1 Tax=Cohaesibacter celericrescens TaxID=2067669 RepID=A0A2N5XWT5_9HYPH|nr:methylenetetrahydrofolate reductase [NAD(P)H] [Cohaesibacter celericrescens]PLW75563.1 methylenetetrahydrofolate reductase [NAD(P)H] [Cohaesibacter celericrescens]PLW78970.1 methylenetetrahydrofolate reductase [NAD(P)H] [Cohaesibacter celericrescens]
MNHNAERSGRRSQTAEKLNISFEFFPPKTPKMEENLWACVKRLAPLCPDFVSVTYGAGGSTRERTHATVERIITETHVPAAAHLTCVGATKAEVNEVVESYAACGVKHIVALRGDPADGVGSKYVPHADGYVNAADLVAGIRDIGGFEVSVSAYPEKHPESPDFATDIEMLRQKVDAGATRAITQFFFDNDLYEAYVERARRAGIFIPIVPGILPIHNFVQMANFAGRTGASVPQWLANRFEGLDNDPETHRLVAAAIAAEQVNDLHERGVDDFHFYTMNRANLSYAICHLLGMRPVAV